MPDLPFDRPSIKPAAWLDQHRPVEQMTWYPGEPMLICDRLIAEGGWIARPGSTVFNLYRPPHCQTGDPDKAEPWLDHVAKVYPDDADHIIHWLAHRVQKPAEKINHALLLGGPPGIGKDTLLFPVTYAIGPWNFSEVTPVQLLGRFNGFIKSVILRINEARDLGEINRYSFYEHCKPLIAAPPEVLRCDEKNIREYSVPNVTGVIITSNYLTDGCFLPADDRRHYVAWSPLAGGRSRRPNTSRRSIAGSRRRATGTSPPTSTALILPGSIRKHHQRKPKLSGTSSMPTKVQRKAASLMPLTG